MAEQRALRLIEAAIELFGRDGFEAVTTRAISEAAGAQQSAISYHFGSKEKIYLACAGHIAETFKARFASQLSQSMSHKTPAEAKRAVETLLSGLLAAMLDERIAPMARFVVREQMNPTAAFELMWENAIRPMAEPLVQSLAVIAGDKSDIKVLKVRAFTLVGQVFAFRFQRASLARLTGWKTIGAVESKAAQAAVLANARAILDDLKKGGGA